MSRFDALPPFSYHWVGGDMRGLHALAAECMRVAEQIADADHALSRQVSSVVGVGDWQGKAADEFTKAWDRDSIAGVKLADSWTEIGDIVKALAWDLAAMENSLEGLAHQLEKQGIPVDTATGTPLADVAADGKACVSPQTVVARGKLISDYMFQRDELLLAAEAAREHAVGRLQSVTETMLPPTTDWGQLANDLDSLRGLWAIPTERRKLLQEMLPELNKNVDSTQRAAWQELIAARKQAGNAARLDQATKDNASAALQERGKVQGKIDSAPENASTKLADGDAEGLGWMGVAADGVKAIPLIGATAGAGITIYQDRQAGESWRHSVADGVVSNVAGVGAGAAAMAGGVAVMGAIGAAPVAAVAVGTVASVGAAVGVGDFVHNAFQENWGQDMHQHGVLDGIGHGIADSWDKTRHDMAHYLDDINPF